MPGNLPVEKEAVRVWSSVVSVTFMPVGMMVSVEMLVSGSMAMTLMRSVVR